MKQHHGGGAGPAKAITSLKGVRMFWGTWGKPDKKTQGTVPKKKKSSRRTLIARQLEKRRLPRSQKAWPSGNPKEKKGRRKVGEKGGGKAKK